MRCAVFGCNIDDQAKHYKTGDVKFFRFPAEASIRKAWQNACCRKDAFNLANARVCSKHFKDSDYARNLKHELLGYSPKNARLLKPEVVPTENLPRTSFTTTTSASERHQRVVKRNSSKLVNVLLKESKSQTKLKALKEAENQAGCSSSNPPLEEIKVIGTPLPQIKTETLPIVPKCEIKQEEIDIDDVSLLHENIVFQPTNLLREDENDAISNVLETAQFEREEGNIARVCESITSKIVADNDPLTLNVSSNLPCISHQPNEHTTIIDNDPLALDLPQNLSCISNQPIEHGSVVNNDSLALDVPQNLPCISHQPNEHRTTVDTVLLAPNVSQNLPSISNQPNESKTNKYFVNKYLIRLPPATSVSSRTNKKVASKRSDEEKLAKKRRPEKVTVPSTSTTTTPSLNEMDATDLLFLSYARVLKTFSWQKQLQMKFQINEMFMKAELEDTQLKHDVE